MPLDFRNFLAASVMNDGHIVSYRSLGRELKVHSNAAKKMLYEFYITQTNKSPSSVNATYLLDGVPKSSNGSFTDGYQQDGADKHMQSSPYMSDLVLHQEDQEEAAPSRSIVLAKEEDLEEAKTKFELIHSVHIYSLGPSRVQNLQILSDCNRAISAKHANEDPLVFQEKYGIIHNTGAKRRTGGPPSIGPPLSSQRTSIDKGSDNSQDSIREQKKGVKPLDRSLPNDRSIKSNSKAAVAPEMKAEGPRNLEKPAGKRSAAKKEPSDIFKPFSRPRVNSKLEKTDIPNGASAAPSTAALQSKSEQEDGIMKDASENEQEDDFMASMNVNPRTSKSKSERAEQLRKMMEDEDEEMEDAGSGAPLSSQEKGPLDRSSSQIETSADPPNVAFGGRRRGRRKVMKKKTVKDEEGYLVTKAEPAWESFSEDEPLPQQKTLGSTTASSVGKGKKTAGKPGQGNIMSFFGKK